MSKNEETSVFDPEAFMHDEVEGALDDKYTPIIEGDWTAYIDRVEADTRKGKDGEQSHILEVYYAVMDEEVKEAAEMDDPTVRQTVWLDIEKGRLARGKNKNIQLGRIRTAVNQNERGVPWSPHQLVGAGPVKIKVEHSYNLDTGDGPYARVVRVVAA